MVRTELEIPFGKKRIALADIVRIGDIRERLDEADYFERALGGDTLLVERLRDVSVSNRVVLAAYLKRTGRDKSLVDPTMERLLWEP